MHLPRLQIDARPRVTVITGRSGSGKSTFALRLLVNERVVCRYVFDARGEYSNRLGLPQCYDLETLKFAEDDGFALFDPGVMFPGRHAEAFSWFCNYVTSRIAAPSPDPLPLGRKILFVDEVWKYCDRRSIPEPLAVCVQEGRKLQLETVFATQLPHQLAQGITNEATEVVAFNVRENLALDRLAEFGLARERISALPPGAFIARNLDSGGELSGNVF
jgi:hypothetical protein